MKMKELDQYSQDIMLKFLQAYFPVKKLKDGRRFKRGIIIEPGFSVGPTRKIYLKPQSELHALFVILYSILEDVFDFSKLEINMVLLKYLNVI